jgi:hypothetical protein
MDYTGLDAGLGIGSSAVVLLRRTLACFADLAALIGVYDKGGLQHNRPERQG